MLEKLEKQYEILRNSLTVTDNPLRINLFEMNLEISRQMIEVSRLIIPIEKEHNEKYNEDKIRKLKIELSAEIQERTNLIFAHKIDSRERELENLKSYILDLEKNIELKDLELINLKNK